VVDRGETQPEQILPASYISELKKAKRQVVTRTKGELMEGKVYCVGLWTGNVISSLDG